MDIKLTEQERTFLTEFAKKQYEGAKDNVCTKTPIHVVERIEKEFVATDEDADVWIDIDGDFAEYKSPSDLIDACRKRKSSLPSYGEVEYECINDVFICDEESYCRAYNIRFYSGRYVQHYVPVAFFFIRDEAVRYKDDYQAHNCADCRIYTYGLGYSNQGDLPVFRALLMRMGHQILSEEKEGD